ncbi:hypothetical protein QN277_025070 [Acacia crassicarpa]|uniref:Uncharacterized protein n=1 Tax=Acacia crassicarpa TaxID=499986 RepID=A0AAE1MKY5_9FABA|nr:hypothetical protein QN277_025070 [Acacia crassicarpa]
MENNQQSCWQFSDQLHLQSSNLENLSLNDSIRVFIPSLLIWILTSTPSTLRPPNSELRVKNPKLPRRTIPVGKILV